jgi:calcineurin-like phosphoesterase family protein
MYWFTSDWHLGHKNIIKYCSRPFNSVEEMNETIVNNLLNVLKPGDTVFHLGDFTFQMWLFEWFLKKFPQDSSLVLFLGNHDPKQLRNKNSYNYNYRHVKIKQVDSLNLKLSGQPIALCHYPFLTWDKSHHGAWNLYGHKHRDISKHHVGKQMNVCVDVNDYMPVSLDQVSKYMETQPKNWDLLKKTST